MLAFAVRLKRTPGRWEAGTSRAGHLGTGAARGGRAAAAEAGASARGLLGQPAMLTGGACS
jgi:hypothetical protein